MVSTTMEKSVFLPKTWLLEAVLSGMIWLSKMGKYFNYVFRDLGASIILDHADIFHGKYFCFIDACIDFGGVDLGRCSSCAITKL